MMVVQREISGSPAALHQWATAGRATAATWTFRFDSRILSQSFFDKAADALQKFGQHASEVALGRTAALASIVEALTPHYGHYVSPVRFNTNMIKINLLDKAGVRKELSEKTMMLHGMLALTAKLRSQWPMHGHGRPEDEEEGVYGCAQTTFAGARACLTVIAAASILLEMTGPEQKAQANKFLAKDREAELGKALADAVKKLC
jgi:hypothetical protein